MTLKLIATDTDDLKIVASALQDAILRTGDIRYDQKGRSVSLRLSRFRHEAGVPERIECGARIDGVMAMQSQGLTQNTPDAFLVLLDLGFAETDAPAGKLDLTFAGGGGLRLSVEALDILLADVGDGRPTKRQPNHDQST